jgi:diadenosine tetraphosphatase ApaH/serine/threonine PP2A family protein phosphatase
MRVAVVSDIHANLHALEAVLAEIERDSPDELWCLGDLVGYGPRPNECCNLVRERATLSLCGNHDLGVLGTIDLADFAGDAGVAARWTRTVLGTEERIWLETLSPSAVRDGAQLFHASPRDPIWEYVLSDQVALLSLQATTAPLVLVGHSHIPLAVGWDETTFSGGVAAAGTDVALAGARRLLNPGSVGQPRDGDPRAAWLWLDFDAGIAHFKRTSYDIARTQAEIAEAGLPQALALRLGPGI